MSRCVGPAKGVRSRSGTLSGSVWNRVTHSRISVVSSSDSTPGISSHPFVSKTYFCSCVIGVTGFPSESVVV